MDDLVDRLRSYATHFEADVAGEAADELAKLRAENERLTATLNAEAPDALAIIEERDRLRAENERLRIEYAEVVGDSMRLRAENEALRPLGTRRGKRTMTASVRSPAKPGKDAPNER